MDDECTYCCHCNGSSDLCQLTFRKDLARFGIWRELLSADYSCHLIGALSMGSVGKDFLKLIFIVFIFIVFDFYVFYKTAC